MGVTGGAFAAWAGSLSATTVAAGAAVASTAITAYSASQAGKGGAPQMAAPPAPGVQKAIDPNATRSSNGMNAFAGIPGTLLTGAGGISPNSLSTGKTVLGG